MQIGYGDARVVTNVTHLGEMVELSEQLVKYLDEILGGAVRGQAREAHDVREQDAARDERTLGRRRRCIHKIKNVLKMIRAYWPIVRLVTYNLMTQMVIIIQTHIHLTLHFRYALYL